MKDPHHFPRTVISQKPAPTPPLITLTTGLSPDLRLTVRSVPPPLHPFVRSHHISVRVGASSVTEKGGTTKVEKRPLVGPSFSNARKCLAHLHRVG